MRDADEDRGRLIIVHNASEPTDAAPATPDIDQAISVTTSPMDTSTDDETTLALNNATLGRTELMVVEVSN